MSIPGINSHTAQWSNRLNPFSQGWEQPSLPISVFAREAFITLIHHVLDSPSLNHWYDQWRDKISMPALGYLAVAGSVYYLATQVTTLALCVLVASAIAYGIVLLYQAVNDPSVPLYRVRDYIPDQPGLKVGPEILISANLYDLGKQSLFDLKEYISNTEPAAFLLIQDPLDEKGSVLQTVILLTKKEAEFFERKLELDTRGIGDKPGRKVAVIDWTTAELSMKGKKEFTEDEFKLFYQHVEKIKSIPEWLCGQIPEPEEEEPEAPTTPAPKEWYKRLFTPRSFYKAAPAEKEQTPRTWGDLWKEFTKVLGRA